MSERERKKKVAVQAKRIYLRNINTVVYFSRIAAASDDFETGSGSSHVYFLFSFLLTFLFLSSLAHSLTLATVRDNTV